MIELKASIWDSQFDSYWRVIPINTVIKANGELVMGAGLAKEAARRYPDLPKILGEFYSLRYGIYDLEKYKLFLFPTKRDWRKLSSVYLIDSGLNSLSFAGFTGHTKIVSPRLGCGLGGLDWEKQVKPLVEKYFANDDNFIVVSENKE